MRRIFQAIQLRFGFLVFYVVVAIVPFWTLYKLGRESGYFYPTSERVELWKELPDPQAIAILSMVYENDSQGPVMIILRHYQQPCEYRGEFLRLWEDPQWAAQAKAANRAGFDRALKVLNEEWRYYRFENLLKYSQGGRLLSDKQLGRLQELRMGGIGNIWDEQPVDEARVQALRFRIWGIFSLAPKLDSQWRQQKVREGQTRARELIGKIASESLPGNQLVGLRRLQVLTKIAGGSPETVQFAENLARQFQQKALLDLSDPPNLKIDLCILAHCQKLAPGLNYSQLEAKLSEEQRPILKSLEELTSNP